MQLKTATLIAIIGMSVGLLLTWIQFVFAFYRMITQLGPVASLTYILSPIAYTLMQGTVILFLCVFYTKQRKKIDIPD